MSGLAEVAAAIAAQGYSAPQLGRDPVNQAMINNWVEAIGDTNPVYADGVAPPAMAQVWSMRGLRGARAVDDPFGHIMAALQEAGYTSVVATNSDQTYHRYLRDGEHVAASTCLEGVVGPKRTALGEGWFVTTRTRWLVGDEVVAEMVFRVLGYRRPAPQPTIIDASDQAASALRPVISRDTEFFWEGCKLGELRIQRWGEVLRHPPGPVDPGGDMSRTPDYVVAAGTGTVFSFVVHHHPQVPGKKLPFVVALVELTEGVRVMGEVVGDAAVESVAIGTPVRAVFLRIDDDLTLPAWEVVR